MGTSEDHGLGELLAQVVPGSALRDGLERILRARMGALIVLGDGPEVLEICSGGFHIDAGMSPQRLSELAKMDGAIVLDRAGERIAWANVHLVPDPSAPTTETGTRHRTAERVARCVAVQVVAVSEEMGTITLYRGGTRRQLRSTDVLVGRANHLMQTLDRFRLRLDEVSAALTASEIEDLVTVRDVALVLQRAEMVLRVAEEIGELVDELGEHGRLLRLQLAELTLGVRDERRLIVEDYLDTTRGTSADEVLGRLAALPTTELLGVDSIVEALAAGGAEAVDPDGALAPRGLRLLRRVPQLSVDMANSLVAHFGDLHRLVRAPASELAEATGISEEDARLVKDGVARLAESSILDRYS
ncbi:MAG: putative nucleic-acid-binding protein (contains the domain) [Acidimicrobiaceae bacterium]|jgi:diadenylate cyclase|nr:putative nucleic-acid-binding protein (contains the domain) [Acidimicrobiaceae bacterium]